MKKVNRLITNICSDNLGESRDFYTSLFALELAYDSDWFVQLISPDKTLELGIISRTSEMVPKDFQQNPQGFYLTFVVENADEIYKIALSKAFEIVSPPADTFYGQRRLLLKDPNGALVDISSPIKDFKF